MATRSRAGSAGGAVLDLQIAAHHVFRVSGSICMLDREDTV